MKYIDNFLNSITMYRLVLYGLTAITLVSLGLSVTGVLAMDIRFMLLTLVVLLASSFAFNSLFAKLFKVPANIESVYITAYILFLILPPAESLKQALVLCLIALVAMLSKFVINYKGKHLFNPAALAVFVISLTNITAATWWVGSKVMFPFVLILALLMWRKVRRSEIFFAFLAFALGGSLLTLINSGSNWKESIYTALFSWPVIFFGSIMLTEPLTLPPTKKLRIIYSSLAGLIFGIPLHIGIISSTPEVALFIGNIFSFLVSPKGRPILKLKERIQIAPLVYEFVFFANQKLSFEAGQYMDWTLDDNKADSRGNRRFFTIASSPTENEVHLGVKIPAAMSSFKKKLLGMQPGDTLMGGAISGDFTLPNDKDGKVVAIAGGIGVTPFRSHVKYLTEKNLKSNYALFYVSADVEEFAFKNVFKEAEKVGVKTIYVLSGAKVVPPDWQGKTGYINKEMLEAEVPDFKERTFYLSGPNAMVDAYKKMLTQAGVSRKQIHTDYFPGY